MKNIIYLFLLVHLIGFSQVKIGNNPNSINPNSILELESTNKGLLLPRLALTSTLNATPLVNHIAGMTVYNTATTGDVTPGFYFNNGVNWIRIADAKEKDNDWHEVGGSNAPNDINDNIFTNGKVGIGTISPSNNLHVISTGTSTDVFSTSNTVAIMLENATDGKSIIEGFKTKNSSGVTKEMYLGISPNYQTDGYFLLTRTGLNDFTMNLDNGNIGIGGTPSEKLDITNGFVEVDLNYGIGRSIQSTSNQYIVYPHRSGIQGLGGAGSLAPYTSALSLESDALITFVETDSDNLIGWMDVNNENFVWNGDIYAGTKNEGTATLRKGTSSQSGYLEIFKGNGTTRLGYIGYNNTNLEYASESSAHHYFKGGNVGINTSSPTERLQVNGNALVHNLKIGNVGHGNNWPGIAHSDAATTTKYALVQNSAGQTILNASTGQDLKFRHNNITQMVLNSDGNLGIGVNSPTIAKLDVNGNTIIRNRLQFGNATNTWIDDPITGMTDGTFSNDAFLFIPVRNGSTSELRLYMTDDNNESFSIWGGSCTGGSCGDLNAASQRFKVEAGGLVTINNLGSGTVQSDANGSLSVSSDERLKNISNNFSRGLESLEKIKPIQYNWNEISGLDTKNLYTGFSAQNIKENIPEAVGEDKKGYLTLDNRPIIATLVNAINELKLIVEKQQTEIDKLKNQ